MYQHISFDLGWKSTEVQDLVPLVGLPALKEVGPGPSSHPSPKHHETTLEMAVLRWWLLLHVVLCGSCISRPDSATRELEKLFHLFKVKINGWTPQVRTCSSDCWCYKKNVKSCSSQQNYSVFCAYFEPGSGVNVVPQYVVGLQPMSTMVGVPPWRREKREQHTVKHPYLGERPDKCLSFCLALETMGSLLPVEKLCCKLCFSDRRISACIEKSSWSAVLPGWHTHCNKTNLCCAVCFSPSNGGGREENQGGWVIFLLSLSW